MECAFTNKARKNWWGKAVSFITKLGKTRQTSRQTSSSLDTNKHIHKIWFIIWLAVFVSPLFHFPTSTFHRRHSDLNACGDANVMIFLDTGELTHIVPFSILHFKGNYSRTHLRKRKIQGKQNHYWFLVHLLRKERAQYYKCCPFTTCTCILTLRIVASKLLAKSTADYVFKIQKDSVFGK